MKTMNSFYLMNDDSKDYFWDEIPTMQTIHYCYLLRKKN